MTSSENEPRFMGVRVPLPVPDFWRLWVVGVILFMGRWIDTLAMAVYVYQRTGSAFLVSLLVVLRFLPLSLFGMIIGALADRYERRSLLILLNVGLLVTSLTLVILEIAGLLEVWHLMVASFLGGFSTTADNPIRRIMIGEVVGPERIGAAMSIDVGASNGTRTFGPFIAGALLATMGIVSVFVLDVVMYAIATMIAVSVRCRNQSSGSAHEPVLRGLAEGWAICRASPKLMGTLILTIVFNIFVYPYTTLVPVVGSDVLHLDAAQIGILASMDGLGSLLGAVLIGAMVRQAQFQRLYVICVAGGHVTILLFALAASALLSGSALLITGVMVAGFAVGQNTLIFLLTPNHARARMMGLLSVSIGVGPIGMLTIGALADRIGPAAAVTVMSLLGIVTLVLSRRYWLGLFSRVA